MDGEIGEPNITTQKDIKEDFYIFFKDFKVYLQEYLMSTVNEICITELPVKGQIKLFDGFMNKKVRIKNQGHLPCYISTNLYGGYRLDPSEIIELYVNKDIIVTTLSGSTSLGIIKT